jgi:ribose/xylose/arabinose/galactoside ABC-type transport system permease subunit
MLVKCWFHFREERFQSEFVKAESLVVYTLLALLIFIITNKVFSPQYMIWIIPFAALLKLRPALLMLAVCLTTYIMVSVGSFRQLDYVKIVWLNVRNILILGLSLWIFLGYLPSRNSLFRQNHLN